MTPITILTIVTIGISFILLSTIDDRTWKKFLAGIVAFVLYAGLQSTLGAYKMTDKMIVALEQGNVVTVSKEGKKYTLGIIAVNETVEK